MNDGLRRRYLVFRERVSEIDRVSSTRSSGSRLISTSCAGVSICSFMRSTRFVPPAMNLAVGWEADAQADAISLAR